MSCSSLEEDYFTLLAESSHAVLKLGCVSWKSKVLCNLFPTNRWPIYTPLIPKGPQSPLVDFSSQLLCLHSLKIHVTQANIAGTWPQPLTGKKRVICLLFFFFLHVSAHYIYFNNLRLPFLLHCYHLAAVSIDFEYEAANRYELQTNSK